MASDIAIAAYVKAGKALSKAEDTSIFHYRGSVATYQDLPQSPSGGDVYTITATGAEYAWTGTAWNELGSLVVVDDALSGTSLNPVQNKVVKGAIDELDALGNGIKSMALNSMTTVRDTTSTSKTIAAEENTRYIFGELTALTVSSMPVSGIVDILFDSGSTATTLILPNSVVLPEWFDASDLNANTRYELNFADGNCVITSWPIAVESGTSDNG